MQRHAGPADAGGPVAAASRTAPPEVPARLARLRADIGCAVIVGVVIVQEVTAGLLARFAGLSAGAFLLAFFAFIPASMIIALPMARGKVAVHGPRRSLLTAKTYTGWRTVDLDRLTRIRLLTIANRYGPSDEYLILRDDRGIRISLRKWRDAGPAIRAALQRSATQPGRPKVKVSPAALGELGLAKKHEVWLVARAILTIIPMVIFFALVEAVSLPIFAVIAGQSPRP